MKIDNPELTEKECEWLNSMMNCGYPFHKEIIEQINHAKIEREATAYYYFLRFFVRSSCPPIPCDERVPITMEVKRPNAAPVEFLLHILHGYIYEIEIFNADSSSLEDSFIISDDTTDFLIRK